MSEVVLGVFTSNTDAEYAIHDVKNAGFNPEYISLLVKNQLTTPRTITEETTTAITPENLLGSLNGFLSEVKEVTLLGTGSFFISGPLAKAFNQSNNAGLSKTLVHLGMPEEEVSIYEEHLKAGSIVVAFHNTSGYSEEIQTILEENDAGEIRTVDFHLRERIRSAQV